MPENFKQIQGFPDYEIGDLGTVKRLKFGKERILKPGVDRYGYANVTLSKENLRYKVLVHRLVATHFIPNPENKPTVNHIDGNKLNNEKSNLDWNTRSENSKHGFNNGLIKSKYGSSNGNAKLTPEQVEQIRKLKGQKTQKEIGIMFGISQAQVSNLHTKKVWIW